MQPNVGPWRPDPAACKILNSYVWGLSKNLCDLTVALSQHDILFCFETLDSNLSHISEFLFLGFGSLVFLCRYMMPRACWLTAFVRDGYGEFRQPKFECGCYEVLVFRVCSAKQNFYVFSLYLNPDIFNRIYNCF